MKLWDDFKYPQIQASMARMVDEPNDLRAIYEWGIFNGTSLVKTYNKLVKYGIPFGNIFAIDSFEGLPAEEGKVFEKFSQGCYKASKTPSEIRKMINYPRLQVIKRWFDKLTDWDAYMYNMGPAKFIHIDCDLYSSTKQALDFMYRNNLIVVGTIIAFDEFMVGSKKSESFAHYEMMSKYNVFAECFWQFFYKDKDTKEDINQSAFQITRVGVKNV